MCRLLCLCHLLEGGTNVLLQAQRRCKNEKSFVGTHGYKRVCVVSLQVAVVLFK